MADCSKTVEFLREWDRMCSKYTPLCGDCPMSAANNGMNHTCWRFVVMSHDAIAIVQKWSDEHPVMTWAAALKTVFPNADVCSLTAHACPGWIFGYGPNRYKAGMCCDETFNQNCVICWNGEYKEAEK